MENNKLFDVRLRESCEDLFKSINVPAWSVDQPRQAPADRQIVSVVGFGGWQVRGSLVFRAVEKFFQATHPAARTTPNVSQDALLDWAGELTNQLLGRFKNKMLAHGLDFQVGIPATLVGHNIIEPDAERDDVVHRQFRTAVEAVSVSLTARLAPGVELFETQSGKIALVPGRPIDL